MRQFWQCASLGLGFASAYFLARGSFAITPEAVAAMGGTYWDFNPTFIVALAHQAAEGRAGFALLALSVAFQLPTLRRSQEREGKGRPVIGALLGLALAMGAY